MFCPAYRDARYDRGTGGLQQGAHPLHGGAACDDIVKNQRLPSLEVVIIQENLDSCRSSQPFGLPIPYDMDMRIGVGHAKTIWHHLGEVLIPSYGNLLLGGGDTDEGQLPHPFLEVKSNNFLDIGDDTIQRTHVAQVSLERAHGFRRARLEIPDQVPDSPFGIIGFPLTIGRVIVVEREASYAGSGRPVPGGDTSEEIFPSPRRLASGFLLLLQQGIPFLLLSFY